MIGKWLSEDPIGFAAGDTNVTRYVANRVLTMVDPDGLELMLGTYGAGRGEEYAAFQDGDEFDSTIFESESARADNLDCPSHRFASLMHRFAS